MHSHREIQVTEGSITSKGLHNNSNNPYVQLSPANPSSAAAKNPNPMDKISGALNNCSRKVEEASRHAENMVGSIWNHVRMSSSPADATMARLVQGTKVLTNGGSEKLFQQTFGVFPGEKLLNQYICYISTTNSGPVIGTLYITTKRLAFCSDYPICHYPFSLQHQCLYYKVVVQLAQLWAVNPTTNRFNSKEKYIEIVTVDGYEFLFMGFVSYDKALKTLNEVLHQHGNSSTGNNNGHVL